MNLKNIIMNNLEFVKNIVQHTGLSLKEAEMLTADMTGIIVDEISKGNAIVFPDMGTLELKVKAARKMYSPNTKSYHEVPESKTIAFKPTNEMKGKVRSTRKKEVQ